MTLNNDKNYEYDGGKVIIIGSSDREENSKKWKERTERAIEEANRVLDKIDEMKRGRWDNVHFDFEETTIEYYKLVQITEKEKKHEYLETIDRIYPEWVFYLHKHGFEEKNATRISITDTNFLHNALSQTDDSYAVKVKEELQFDEGVKENALQYYKIISKDEPKREWSEDKGTGYRFQYRNGVRYSLTNLEQATAVAKEINGLVVKVTEQFFENK